MTSRTDYISPEQLCVGLYVHLDMSWTEHPLTFNSFKIRNQKQIDTIRQLGLSQIRYEPGKCDSPPLPPPVPAPAAAQRVATAEARDAQTVGADAQAVSEKVARLEQLKRIRRDIAAVEGKFREAADAARTIRHLVDGSPQKARREAESLVGRMVSTLASEDDVALHAMSNKLGDGVYFHSLNVTVLSLMLARALSLGDAEMHELGLGALFHDFGKTEIPDAILLKTDPPTKSERALLEMHCEYGLGIAGKAGLQKPALDIVMQHHEYVDGTGYPRKLVGHQISRLARLVTIVNSYDNLCNPVNPDAALTPSEALAQMFAHHRARFDEVQFPAFIRCLGVYPPGSVVRLSNDMPGLVLSANPDKPLKPNVLVYDEGIPAEEAVIVTLSREPELRISRSLRPADLPAKVCNYLNPRKRVTYFFDVPPPDDPQ
jgi:putative nucleotidyltransferase with HDIG domain